MGIRVQEVPEQSFFRVRNSLWLSFFLSFVRVCVCVCVFARAFDNALLLTRLRLFSHELFLLSQYAFILDTKQNALD